MKKKGNNHLTLFLPFVASLVCHTIILVILIYFPVHAPYNKKFSHSVINVSMVTLPVQESASSTTGQIKRKSKIQSTLASKIISASINTEQSRSKAVSVTTQKDKKIKKSLKKETFKSSKIVKNAIKKIEEQIENSMPNPVTAAINRLKSKVGSTKTKDIETKKEKLIELIGQGGNMPSGKLPAGYQTLKQIDIYRAEIPYYIEKNWAFSEQLTSNETNLVAVVVIQIMQNGKIKDIWFEKKSNNNYFDESVFKAVKKSDPLPELPKEYLKAYYNLGLIFTPSGLKKSIIKER